MKTALLYRKQDSDEGTFGYLVLCGKTWHSLELPERENKPNISRIPFGEYLCKTRFSPRFKRVTFHLQDVEGRSYILLHSANFAGDVSKNLQTHLNGCITLGKGIGKIKNKFGEYQKAVLTSRTAVREFMQTIDEDEFKLIIKEW